jgi:hypothetical protein
MNQHPSAQLPENYDRLPLSVSQTLGAAKASLEEGIFRGFDKTHYQFDGVDFEFSSRFVEIDGSS